MASQDSGGGGSFLNLNSILAIVTLLGGAWLVSHKLASNRPVNASGGLRDFVGEQQVESRLWEDPFKFASKQDLIEGQIEIGTNLTPLLDQITEHSRSGEQVLVLPVMISGGDYSEDQESRIRSRFAIVSALGQSGYAPEDAEHIGWITVPWPTAAELKSLQANETSLPKSLASYPFDRRKKSASDKPAPPLDLRYEWYRPRTFQSGSALQLPKTNVLVLWLNNSFFDDEPLLRLPYLLSHLVDQAGRIAVIGPRTSSTLRGLLPGQLAGTTPLSVSNSNLWKLVTNVNSRVELYSATASAMDETLVDLDAADVAPRSAVRDAMVHTNAFKSFKNFVATDSQLAGEMLDELALRGAAITNSQNHVVLISEWDTFFGRILSLTYAAEMKTRQIKNLTRHDFVRGILYASNSISMPANLHSFVYLRGLDGQTAGGGGAEAHPESRGRRGPTSFDEFREWSPDANKAEGTAQFDYLSRLGDRLEELQQRLRREGRGRIKAIGIVGSDAYDTLLILQALRSRFPQVWFFTTDLDVRLWHPREREWSRNLVLTSGYGLMLNRELQGAVPPFRDSQQTAQFAATLAALGNPHLSQMTNPTIVPRRFEVGNKTVIDLSLTNPPLPGATFGLHPETISESEAARVDKAGWFRPGALAAKILGLGSRGSGRFDPRLLSLSIAIIVLAMLCWLWQPLRNRTFDAFKFPVAVLRYDETDGGGPEGVAAMRTALANDKELPNRDWWREVLARCDKEISEESGDRTETDAEKSATQRQRQTSAFILFLNKVLHRQDPADAPPGSGVAHSPPSFKFSGWKPLARFRVTQMYARRQALDALLDTLAKQKTIGDASVSLESAHSARRVARKLFWLRVCEVIGFWLAGLLIAVLASGVAVMVWKDTFQIPTGEPFSLTSGISAWPALILRLMATLLAFVFCLKLYTESRFMFYELTRRYRLQLPETGVLRSAWVAARESWKDAKAGPEVAHVFKIGWGFVREVACSCGFYCDRRQVQPASQVGAAKLWISYWQRGHWLGRLLRTVAMGLIYFFLIRLVMQFTTNWFQPTRGDAIRFLSSSALRDLMTISFMALTFLTIDAARLCCWFIEQLSSAPTRYSQATKAYFRSQRGDVHDRYLEEWIDLQLIADLTERVGRLLWLPSVVFLLTLLARFEWWDHWPWNMSLVIAMALNFLIALASIVILQRAAKVAKNAAEESLAAKVKLLQAQTASNPEANQASQAEKLLEDIRNLHRGAFASMWQNPVIGAVFLQSGGLTLIQLLTWFAGR
jgi:hypothetical protein